MKQPDKEIQEILSDLQNQEPEVVSVGGRKVKIGWLHNSNTRKFSHVMLKEDDPWKRNVKVCACVLLNHKWGILTWFLLNVWYGIYWRWLYYIRDIDQVEVMTVLISAKKKIQSELLTVNTTLATAMMDTMMTIARHESGQAAHVGVQPTP